MAITEGPLNGIAPSDGDNFKNRGLRKMMRAACKSDATRTFKLEPYGNSDNRCTDRLSFARPSGGDPNPKGTA